MTFSHKKSGIGIELVLFIFLSILPMTNVCITPRFIQEIKIIGKEKIIQDNIEINYYDSTLNQLKYFEGFRTNLYKCPSNKWTIGYGFNYPNIWNKKVITKIQADSILKLHFDKCLNVAKKDGLTGNKALAIADFIYNIGEYGYKRSTLRKFILQNKSIDKKLLEYRRGNGKILKGLIKRRAWELKLFNT